MTSNEIAQRDDQQAVATTQPANHLPAPTEGSTALMAWAQEAELAYQMAQKLADTSFVPATLRGKPGDITAAILAGAELGLKPMATLKSIDVIQGTPALRAHAMRAVVQQQGHQIELVESTPERCIMRGRRKDSDTWQTVEWTTAHAEIVPAKAPLSVASLTAPAPQPAPAADGYSVQIGNGDWDTDAADDSTDWQPEPEGGAA